jgi:hypothetical protein
METIREAKQGENEARTESKKARMVDPVIVVANFRRRMVRKC